VVSFAEPSRLTLLVLPALASVLAVYRHRRRRGQQRRLASPGVWVRLLGGVPATGLARLLMWCGAAALIVLALARPQWGEQPNEESVRTRDLVVALDVSDSMRCEDVRPSRLTRSIETLQRLLPELEGNRLAVVVFSGDAYPLVPLTTDLSAVGVFLDGVEAGMVALPGSNLERAVNASLELLPDEGEGRVLMLFSDGENLQGDVDAATAALKNSGVGLVGLVAGTERGGPIPETDQNGGVHYKRDAGGQPVVTRAHPEVLEAIADQLDGEVVSLSDTDVVREVAAAIDKVRTRELTETQTIRRIERFPVFLAAAAALLFLGFALSPWRRLAVAALALAIAVPGVATAQSVAPAKSAPAVQAPAANDAAEEEPLPKASWWQRLIPGGGRRLARSGLAKWNAGDLEGATTAFSGAADLQPEAPDRLYDLGTTLAANGRLDAAQPLLEEAAEGGARDAAFNAGTAALEQSEAQSAVEWLRRAMIASPDDLGAKHNYELALKMLEEQQKQQQQDQQNDQEQQQDQDQDKDKDKDQQKNGDRQQPTPTPSPSPGQQGAAPTPTPNPNQPLFAALDRAEADAREAMQSPTPQAGKVEKDW
jgi:Ca-activated chloride channel family protein